MRINSDLNITIVEDDLVYLKLLKKNLETYGLNPEKCYTSGEAFMKSLDEHSYDLVFLDYDLGEERNGLEILRHLKSNYPITHVVIISAQNKLEVAINAMKFGALDYISKTQSPTSRFPFIMDAIAKRKKKKTVYRLKSTIGLSIIAFLLLIILVLLALI